MTSATLLATSIDYKHDFAITQVYAILGNVYLELIYGAATLPSEFTTSSKS